MKFAVFLFEDLVAGFCNWFVLLCVCVRVCMVDMATDLVASRLMVRNAARMLDEKHASAPTYAAMAKAFATEKCFDVRLI